MLRITVGLTCSLVFAFASMAGCSSDSTGNTATGGNGTIIGSGGSSAGGVGGGCTDQTITCVDATTATGCNSKTGVVDTFSCVDELKAIGIISNGCTKDPTGDFCSIDDFSDQACADGATAYGYCENATSNEQLFNIYVNCFENNMKGHSKYVTPMMKTSADCVMAENACIPGLAQGGAGPGPAPSQAGAGQGGAP